MDLVDIAKDAIDYERWVSAQPRGKGNKKARAQARRIAYREHIRSQMRPGANPGPTAHADIKAARKKAQVGRPPNKRDIAAVQTKQAFESGELKKPKGLRAKVLRATERKYPRAAKAAAAMAAGAAPGALAGLAAGGPVGGAIGGALGASIAYPAASYAANVSTMKYNPEKKRPQHRYREGAQKKLWDADRKKAYGSVVRETPAIKPIDTAEVMQRTNRNLNENLPGAARRRVGAMAYGARPIGRFAAPVALGGLVAGGTAGAAVKARAARSAKKEVARRAASRKALIRRGAAGAALVGAGSLGAAALRRKED